MKLNYLKMLEEIDELVEQEWLNDTEWKAIHHRPFTQEESEMMSNLLGQVYSVAHGIHCTACGKKYLIPKK